MAAAKLLSPEEQILLILGRSNQIRYPTVLENIEYCNSLAIEHEDVERLIAEMLEFTEQASTTEDSYAWRCKYGIYRCLFLLITDMITGLWRAVLTNVTHFNDQRPDFSQHASWPMTYFAAADKQTYATLFIELKLNVETVFVFGHTSSKDPICVRNGIVIFP